MDANINKKMLDSLIKEVDAFIPAASPRGLMNRRIREMGFYEEAGLRFEREDYAVGQLYAGLAILAHDMYQYLARHERYLRDDAALFNEVVALVSIEESRVHGDKAFPSYVGLPIAGTSPQLALAADHGHPTVKPLEDRGIVHEWTFKPGKRLFETLWIL